jgi:hypothetical protein
VNKIPPQTLIKSGFKLKCLEHSTIMKRAFEILHVLANVHIFIHKYVDAYILVDAPQYPLAYQQPEISIFAFDLRYYTCEARVCIM